MDLHVMKRVPVSGRYRDSDPAEEEVRGGLHQTLSHDDLLAVIHRRF
jgi:hypothetical protein